jgi:hypothetical protein
VRRTLGCPNFSALSVSLLLRHFKRVRRRRKKKISVKRLNERKRLLIRGNRWKRRSRSELYNVNYDK